MARQTKKVYLTGNQTIDQILNNLSDRLDQLEGIRPDLGDGYLFLQSDKDIIVKTNPLEAGDVRGTSNQIIVTDNGDETITLSTPQDIDPDADVVFDTITIDKLMFTLLAGLTAGEGELCWNDDDGALNIGMPGGNVIAQVPLEGLRKVTNKTGGTLLNGRCVYVVSALGNRLTVDYTDNTDADKISFLGMLTEDIENNQSGYVNLYGDVRGDSTQPIDTSGFSAGDKLYLSTAGGFTNTHPANSIHAVIVFGRVSKVHATDGIIAIDRPIVFTNGNNFNGTMVQSIINKSAGVSAATGFTSVNDDGHRFTIGIGGSNNAIFPDIAVLYNAGYGDLWQAVDGNKDFVWYTDPTDSHDNSALSNEVMRLVAAGHLKLVKDNSKMMFGAGDDASIYYDSTDLNIKTDEVAASDLLLTCGANKTIELQSVVYDDIQVSLSSAKVPASSAPTWRTHNFGIVGGVDYSVLGFAIGDYIDLYVQTSHSMKLNTVLDLHVHGTIPSDDSGKKIKWQLDVAAAGIGVDWAVPSGSPFTAEFTLDGTQAGKHNMFEIADIPAVNTTVSSIYIGRLTRIAASSDDYASEVYLLYADCHYQIDTIGSRQECAK